MAMPCPATVRGPPKYKRALPPAHYSCKIESFKVLSMLNKYDFGVFEAGGYKWRLSLYPNVKKEDNREYISLYLSIEKLPHNQTVHVNYKLFVRDKSQNECWTIQDADEAISSFQHSQTRHGFPRFLSLEEFKNGYLEQNDSCTFGAEVFVIQPTKMKESFTLIRYPLQNTFTFKIENWSKLGTDYRSPEFLFQERKWKLKVYQVYPKGNAADKGEKVDPKGNAADKGEKVDPKGNAADKGEKVYSKGNAADKGEKVYSKGNAADKGGWLSVYLEVQQLTGEMKVYADFSLRVLDQLKKKTEEEHFTRWLSARHPKEGNAKFMPLTDLKEGFIEDDTVVVEVQIRVVSKP